MIAVRSAEPICPDFNDVLGALESYSRRTGRPAVRLGGWEIEDEAIGPPDILVERLAPIRGNPHCYSYAKDLGRAKERAAQVLGRTIRFTDNPLAPRNVAVLQNSTQALLLALATLKERGVDRLVVAAPCYYAPVRIAQSFGLAVAVVPAAEYLTGALDMEALRNAVASPGSALLVTNPAYSVGVDYGWGQLSQLFASLPPDCPIILDETRLGLNWRSTTPWYPAVYPENVIVLRSPSKVFFVNGLKCSLLLAHHTLVRSIEQLSEALVGSVPGNAERVALEYLDAWDHWSSEYEAEQPAEMLQWRASVVKRICLAHTRFATRLRTAGFVLSPADSGPYALAALRGSRRSGIDSRLLAEAAGVLVMDSSYFFHTSDEWDGFRLNLCARPRTAALAIERVLQQLGHTARPVRRRAPSRYAARI